MFPPSSPSCSSSSRAPPQLPPRVSFRGNGISAAPPPATEPAAKSLIFPRAIAPRQIIVSFTDRRLYYVPERGTAIAYPIATPRRQDRWQGVLRVTRKRTNPPWTPTRAMLREKSVVATSCTRRPPEESARLTCALPWLDPLSHPRHRCALDNWPTGFQRVRAHAQRRCQRPLPPRRYRHQSNGDLAQLLRQLIKTRARSHAQRIDHRSHTQEINAVA